MDQTPLQRFIKQAIAVAPNSRDHYDKQMQKRTGGTGKPLYDIERGKSKNPALATLVLVAEVLHQPLDLLTRAAQGEIVDAVEWYQEEPDIPATVPVTASDGCVALRQVDLGLSMGDGTNIDHYVDEGTIDFDANLIRSITKTSPERLFVAHGDGDSMFPTLINDDMVVIDTAQNSLNLTDRVWAISLFGAGGIKRLRPVSADEVEVISDNPIHGNQTVNRQDLYIMGRVVWIGRRI